MIRPNVNFLRYVVPAPNQSLKTSYPIRLIRQKIVLAKHIKTKMTEKTLRYF
jgi:hypothetical protein